MPATEMHKTLLLAVLLGGAAVAQELPQDAPAGLQHIRAKSLQKHAAFLADDELGGRYTGTPGQQQAAEYIARHFESLGLEPLGDKKGRKRSFFQAYPLEHTGLDLKGSSLGFGGKTYKQEFAVIPGESDRRLRLSGPFAWCGTGNPDKLPRALARKIPVVYLSTSAGGPRGGMRGNRVLQRAGQVARALARAGARAVVFLIAQEGSNSMDMMNYSALLPGKPHLRFGKGGRGLRRFEIPSLFLAPKPSQLLLQKLGHSFANGELSETDKPKKLRGKLSLHVVEDKRFKAVNVCAVLRGDKREQEAIVYSAHMDHMGTRLDGDAFNGADDNASGSAGLLELAQAFVKCGQKPERSIIFLSVSGEELGLWGSRYYSDNPTWPAKRIVANINIDMIGRHTDLSPEGTVSATPSPSHKAYSSLAQDAAGFAAKLGLKLSNGDTYYARSDHYNFARLGIPVIFFCDGEHGDYHKVTDHADKLDYDKMERITRLAFWTGWAVAQSPRRPRELK